MGRALILRRSYPSAVSVRSFRFGQSRWRDEDVLVALVIGLFWSGFWGVLSFFSYWEGCDSVGCVGYGPILSQMFGWVLIGLLPAIVLVVVVYSRRVAIGSR